ncbi:MAG: L-histidine N(alpha)-methyltransferase [Actinomycetota bacterium]
MPAPEPTIDVHLDPDWMDRALRADVLAGLTSSPKELPPKWFYDDVGSELFDKITRLVEYYPTEAEREILRERASRIVALSGADTFVELGSGTSDKTRVLLEAFAATGQLRRFVPFDVSEGTLRDAAAMIAATWPRLEVHGVVGDFDHHLAEIPGEGRQLTAFLGGTIGNYKTEARARFLASLADRMSPGDALLLGTDLVKETERLELAYDDPAGVTAAFNKNVLAVINRELDADFDLDAFEHVATFDPDHEWMDLRLRSLAAQSVHIAELDLVVDFGAGEEMRTEVSAKFRPERIEAELEAAGLTLVELWTDQAGDYALSLGRR